MSDKGLTHFDDAGRPRMVDVSAKAVTERVARASAVVRMNRAAFEAVLGRTSTKGDPLAAAELAGVMGAKRTADLIPLCHPLPLTGVSIEATPLSTEQAVRLVASVRTSGRTGVEMEALTAVSVAALTLYDMLKALDRAMVIDSLRLEAKSGGASGDYRRAEG